VDSPLKTLAPSHPHPAPTVELQPGDWMVMFEAVRTRLRQTMGDAMGATASAMSGRLPAEVLDCVAALEQLHACIWLERDLQSALEHELCAARTALRRGGYGRTDLAAGA
jgi:hypothetical protein